MPNKKILYLMHINWGWIKQRPHFVAEYLAEEYDITVCFPKSYRLKYGESDGKLKLKELFILPFSRFRIVSLLNQWIIYMQLSSLVNKSDIIWLTHPSPFRQLINKIPKSAHVVYDCMDDILEFYSVKSNPSIRESLAYVESQLLARSNTVIVSSDYLKDKISFRNKLNKKIYVINNAINIYDDAVEPANLPTALTKIFTQSDTKKIIYIGTISEWLDFSLILKSLELVKGITYIFIGPSDASIPHHKQIFHVPPIEHKQIYNIMKGADALIMPFKLTELILSVNPVKVYEYIYSGKPTIVVKYKETEQFADYVYLYETENEYIDIIRRVGSSKLHIKSSPERYWAFAQQNTWAARVAEIVNLLDKNMFTT